MSADIQQRSGFGSERVPDLFGVRVFTLRELFLHALEQRLGGVDADVGGEQDLLDLALELGANFRLAAEQRAQTTEETLAAA